MNYQSRRIDYARGITKTKYQIMVHIKNRIDYARGITKTKYQIMVHIKRHCKNDRPVELEKKSRKWELIARKGFSSFFDSLVYP
jgi:hypothetical protein